MIDLNKEFQTGQKELRKIALEFPWDSKFCYAYWLGQTFYYAQKSTRILALAAAHFAPEDTKYHYRFLDHAREEKGHEKLLLGDLKNLDWKMEQIPELPAMSAFYQSLFYWIEHVNPIGLFGWVMCLEGLAAETGPELYRRAVSAHGEKASTFLKVHANEDVGHIKSAFDQLKDLSDPYKTYVLKNFHQCCGLYGWVFQSIQHLGKTA